MLINGLEPKSSELLKRIEQLGELPNGFNHVNYHEGGFPVANRNPQAWRVEQGEAGFSADKPIGTDGLSACVAVIAHDPLTRKTGIAHVDTWTKRDSLQLLFDNITEQEPQKKPLQIRLVGAGYDLPETYRKSYRDTGFQNVKKIMRFLGNKNVDIISAALFDPKQPHSFVVQPEDFTITADIPNKPNPDRALALAKYSLVGTYTELPLRRAFDLSLSDKREPIFLDNVETMGLRQHCVAKNEEEIVNWLRISKSFAKNEPGIVLSVMALAKEYEKSEKFIFDSIKVRHFAGKSTAETEEQMQFRISAFVHGAGIYIGQGADEANVTLANELESGLFFSAQKRANHGAAL